jgi:hypothetical protein
MRPKPSQGGCGRSTGSESLSPFPSREKADKRNPWRSLEKPNRVVLRVPSVHQVIKSPRSWRGFLFWSTAAESLLVVSKRAKWGRVASGVAAEIGMIFTMTCYPVRPLIRPYFNSRSDMLLRNSIFFGQREVFSHSHFFFPFHFCTSSPFPLRKI